MKKVSKTLKDHYEKIFKVYGPTPKGVDWGEEEKNLNLRYKKILAILHDSVVNEPTFLDVGCGFGGLLRYTNAMKIKLRYTGIDIAENMIKWARKNFPKHKFLLGDILETDFPHRYDYVVCNGILTQKLNTPGLLMDKYAHKLIRRMYSLCLKGIAFNVMTTKVNYFANNLYYRNPAELLSWCMNEISRYIRLDHSYPLFEYTVYIYREPKVKSLPIPLGKIRQ